MKKVLYRTQHYIFSIFVKLVQNKKTKLIKGEDSLLLLPKLLKESKIDSILLVTSEGFIKRKTLEPLFELLVKEGIKYACFTGVHPDPSVDDVENGLKVYLENNSKAIVAIGGGSVLDCAKIIGARASNLKTPVRKMRGMLKIKKKLPPYFPIPTTCGTGSEVTAAAVISDTINDKHYKYAVTDLKLIPDLAILDPKLLSTLPEHMLVTTAMDALTHSLEAYLNLFASKQVKKDSLESVKLIFENINNRDINSLNNLLYASTLAGIAITHNFVGYVHAIAHAMGAMYGLAHGYLNSVILPVVLKAYEPKIEKKMKVLCEYIGLDAKEKYTDAIIEKINEIKQEYNLPKTIKELKEEDINEIVARANKEANPTYPVPLIMNKRELYKIVSLLLER